MLTIKREQEFVVSEQSGCLDFAEKIRLECNHMNSNKFSHPDDNKYRKVCDAIQTLVLEAAEKKRDRRHRKDSGFIAFMSLFLASAEKVKAV
jgi:hypothetical protein